jgi:hypothetical protein
MALSKIDIENMITGEVNVANGGTGLSSGTSGQFLKFTGSTTLASAADNAGKVLQVIEGDTTQHTTSTDSSYVDCNLEATITPASSSNKVLVLVNCNGMKINSSAGGNVQIRIQHDQGGSSFTNVAEYEEVVGYNDNDVNNFSPMILHSPSQTNATKYKVQIAELNGFSSGSFRFNNRNADGGTIRSSIILMEISA